MFPLVGKLLLTGLALGLAVFGASKAGATTNQNGDLPPGLADAVTSALASRDPSVIIAVAVKLRSLGYAKTADDLDGVARELQAEQSVTRTLVQAGVPVTTPNAQPVQTVPVGSPSSPQQTLASQLVLNLKTTAPGRENKQLVSQFQTAESLVADGKYGLKTALALVKYGLVPPLPRAWPKGQEAVARAAFAAALRAQAASDPTRAEEWLQGANAAMPAARPSGSKLVSNTKAPLTEQEKLNVAATAYETGMQSAYEAGRPTAADRA